MQALERHRLILYGRIGLSVALFAVSMVLGTAAAVSGAPRENALWVVGALLGSILVLPRRTRPSEEAREQASSDELERLERVSSWLLWVRGIYLVLAAAVLLGLPQLM